MTVRSIGMLPGALWPLGLAVAAIGLASCGTTSAMRWAITTTHLPPPVTSTTSTTTTTTVPNQIISNRYRPLTIPTIDLKVDVVPGHSPNTSVRFLAWLWVTPRDWKPQSVSASAAGVTAKTTATPTSVLWQMGDGGSVTCTGPGSPWSMRVDPTGIGPDPSGCAYTYHRSTEARGPYKITATIRWSVNWTSNVPGEGGALPELHTSPSMLLNIRPR